MEDKEIKENAVWIAEGVLGYENQTKEVQIKAWQHLVNTGLAWQLQGFFGRTARALIDDGIITEAA